MMLLEWRAPCTARWALQSAPIPVFQYIEPYNNPLDGRLTPAMLLAGDTKDICDVRTNGPPALHCRRSLD